MTNLDTVISEVFRVNGNVYLPKNYTKKEVKIGESSISYISPLIDSIVIQSYNKITELYFKVVAGILYEYEDILVKEIDIGGVKIDRATVWKTYDEFLINLNSITDNKIKFHESLLKMSDNIQLLDALQEFIEKNDGKIDCYDVTEMLTPTMLQQLEAEAIQRRLLKSNPTKSLF